MTRATPTCVVILVLHQLAVGCASLAARPPTPAEKSLPTVTGAGYSGAIVPRFVHLPESWTPSAEQVAGAEPEIQRCAVSERRNLKAALPRYFRHYSGTMAGQEPVLIVQFFDTRAFQRAELQYALEMVDYYGADYFVVWFGLQSRACSFNRPLPNEPLQPTSGAAGSGLIDASSASRAEAKPVKRQSVGSAPYPRLAVHAEIACPVILIYHSGGLGAEAKSGVVAAVWPSGTVLRAKSPKRPWRSHVVGSISGDVLADLMREATADKTWRQPTGEVALDMGDDVLTLRRRGEYRQWAETPGATSTPLVARFRERLTSVAIEKPADVRLPSVQFPLCLQ